MPFKYTVFFELMRNDRCVCVCVRVFLCVYVRMFITYVCARVISLSLAVWPRTVGGIKVPGN